MLFKHAIAAAAFSVAVVSALPRPATIIPRASPSDNEYYRPIVARSPEPEPEPEPEYDDYVVPSHLQPGRFARRLRRTDSDYGNRIRRAPLPPFDVADAEVEEEVEDLKEQLVVIRDDLEDKIETADEAVEEIEELARRSRLKEEIRHELAEEAIELQKREALEDVAQRSQFTEDALYLARRLIDEELERVSKAKMQARSIDL